MYVNKDFERLSVNRKSYINCGKCGNVYLMDDDKIIKTYFNKTQGLCKLDDDTFSILKDIKNPNLIEIYDVYTSLIHYYRYLRGKTEFKVDAYVAKFYQAIEKNVLRDSKEYLLENIRALEVLIHELSDASILVGDLSIDNTVFTDSRMVIVDPDFFSHSTLSFAENQKENIMDFLDYIAFLFIKELIAEEERENKDYSKLKKNIFFENIRARKIFVAGNKSIADEFSKALRFHRSPMEFFTKGE